MKKLVSVLLNAALLIVLALCIGAAYLFLSSYIDIIFKTRSGSTLSLSIYSALWVITSYVVYIPLMRLKYAMLPGTALLNALSGKTSGLRPLWVYLMLTLGLCAAYFPMWMINSYVFGQLALGQEEALKAVNVRLDWKSYFPQYPYSDPDNAAPELKKAALAMDKKNSDEVGRLWEAMSNDDTSDYAKHLRGIAALSSGARTASTLYDKALKRKKLIWNDYRNYNDSDFIKAEFPDYISQRNFVRLKMLEAAMSASAGNWGAAHENARAALAFIRLTDNDPILLGSLVRIGSVETVIKGLVMTAKAAPDKRRSMEFAQSVLKNLPDMRGSALKAFEFEMAGLATMQRLAMNGKADDAVFANAVPQNSLSVFLFMLYYRQFGEWDRYVFLKSAWYALKAAAEPDLRERALVYNGYEKFLADNSRLPATMASIASPSFETINLRLLTAEARKDTALLLVYAIDYRARHGRYPASLAELSPAYLSDLPKNPFNAMSYGYKTSGNYVRVFAEDKQGTPVSISAAGKD